MKATIDGKRYDTEAPRTVEVASGGSPSGITGSDFAWYRESLYRSGGGHWFLAGEGHAASPYCTWHGHGERGPGEKIVPLTPAEAQRWLEDHDETAALDTYFGDSIQDADTPDPLTAELRQIRERRGLTQEGMAAELGLTPNHLARLERGERAVGEPLIRLARLLADRG